MSVCQCVNHGSTIITAISPGFLVPRHFSHTFPGCITVKPVIVAFELIILDTLILAFLLPATLKRYCIQIFAARYFCELARLAKFVK